MENGRLFRITRILTTTPWQDGWKHSLLHEISRLDAGTQGGNLCGVFRQQLKSKIHRAVVTDANIDYEGSITIPTDLMRAVDLWVGERVLVSSITSGARLETYVIEGREGSGKIVVNGAAAHLIGKGHIVTIMAWALDEKPVLPKRVLLDGNNRIVNDTVQ